MTVGGTARTVIVSLVVVGLTGLAAPAAADTGTYDCTVLAGTEIDSPEGSPIGLSVTSPGGGLGECELHTLDERSKITGVTVPDGCQVHADIDQDLIVEKTVGEEEVYQAGTSLIAFCDAGVVMADNGVSLIDI